MSDFPFETLEPNNFCVTCGCNTYNSDFCSTKCMHEYAIHLEQITRPAMSDRQLNAMFRDAEHVEIYEGCELDFAMEVSKEAHQWASDQSRKLHRDFLRMKG